MKSIFVIAEHRQGKFRDVTFEMLACGADLAAKMDCQLTAVLMGSDLDDFTEKLKPWAHQCLVINDDKLSHFNATAYQMVFGLSA